MKKIHQYLLSTFLCICTVLLLAAPSCQAYTDNAAVLAGVDRTTDIYSYLNANKYQLWSSKPSSQHDMYINVDSSVIVDIWNDHLGHIYIMKPGYATDKGIEVGMTLNDLIYAYGTIYDSGNRNSVMQYSKDDRSGESFAVPDNDYYKNYSGYYYVEYVARDNSGLSFVLNKATKRIALIRYQSSRRGNTKVIEDVKRYNLLPYLQ